MPLRKIKAQRVRLADQVYAQILEAIENNDIGHDERLVQEKLAAQLAISRTPVREALLRLEQSGILVSSDRGGFLIRIPSIAEVMELYQVRTAIEGHAVRLLAGDKNPDRSASLIRETIIDKEAITSTTVKAYFQANRDIHRKLVELTGNRYLLEVFDNYWNQGTSFRLFAVIENVDLSKSFGDHMRIADAIESGDPRVAFETVADHVANGFDLQTEALAAQKLSANAAFSEN